MDDDFHFYFKSVWILIIVVAAIPIVVGIAVLVWCCYYTKHRRQPSDFSRLFGVQVTRGEVVRPPSVAHPVVYASAPGQSGHPGPDLVLPPSAYSQQYPPQAGSPLQVCQSSAVYTSQVQQPQPYQHPQLYQQPPPPTTSSSPLQQQKQQ